MAGRRRCGAKYVRDAEVDEEKDEVILRAMVAFYLLLC